MADEQDEPQKQATEKGLEIPVPKRKDVLDVFEKAAKPESDSERRPKQ
jgi:hypothetical protein